MIEQITKDKIDKLHKTYQQLNREHQQVLHDIAVAEIPETVYNSNAIENSKLTLTDTEKILATGNITRNTNIREVFETVNLAKVTKLILDNPNQILNTQLILHYHKLLMNNIDELNAGRFRNNNEWVRIGNHLGANPKFVHTLVEETILNYNDNKTLHFLDNIALFHAEFETIHPFCDGNGRIGRVLINQQLLHLNLPPIIVQNKTKSTHYYPLFNQYHTTSNYDGFTKLFATLLTEALHKRISILTAKKIVPLTLWAQMNNVKTNNAINKAKKQSIPAFHIKEKWMINEDYREKDDRDETSYE
jgi:Fic family protein